MVNKTVTETGEGLNSCQRTRTLRRAIAPELLFLYAIVLGHINGRLVSGRGACLFARVFKIEIVRHIYGRGVM